MRPFESLYIHVPFCNAKCDYCAFYSLPGADAALRRAYLGRLDAELAARVWRPAPGRARVGQEWGKPRPMQL